mmetsp:Transcript_155663/g.274970  ORF Transcript_155663/g.274970 Transcript_155663/m.274970 type:complete len:200 (+) Transcript_155663:113-712(+)
MGGQADLLISVEAESLKGTWRWKKRFQNNATIKDVQDEWASAHHVRADGFECESLDGNILELRSLASELRRVTTDDVCIRVWPVAKEYMSEAEGGSSSSTPSEPSRKRERPEAAEEAAAKASAKPAKKGKASPAGELTTSDSRGIKYQSQNPKVRGGAAFERYEKYKHAKTVGEALSLGAAPGDIKHDVKRGFATIQDG